MKIHPDQINALNREQARAERDKQADGKFGDLLAQEVQRGEAKAAQVSAKAGPIQAPLRPEAVGAEHIPAGREAMDKLDTLLGEWENYAAHLGGGETKGLKQAYGALENISAGIKDLKEKLPDYESHAGLRSMVEEIETMAAAERIKFARGDYS